MKWLSVLSIGVLAFLANACEKHPVSELEPKYTGGAAEHAPAASHAAEPAHAEPEAAAPAEAEKKAEEAKPGEAPKFFPEKK